MKTIGAAFQTHLNGEVTTTNWLWKIVRTDTVVEYYTSHDQPLVFESQTYSPVDSSFSPTSISQSSELNVDNLEVDIILGGVDQVDILAGVYDAADVYFYLVNWQDTTQSAKITRGKFGEAAIENGQARIELRGLMQALQQPMLQVTSPTCRADLGDTKCGVDVGPLTVTGTSDNPFTIEDFRDQTTGNFPTGFTVRWGSFRLTPHATEGPGSLVVADANYQGGKYFNIMTQHVFTETVGYMSIDALDGLDNYDFVMKLKYGLSPQDDAFNWPLFCVGASPSSFTGYIFRSYAMGGNIQWRLFRRAVAGGPEVQVATLPVGVGWYYLGGGWEWIRIRSWIDENGYRRIQVREWATSESDPITWAIDYTDTAPLNVGAAHHTGLYCYDMNLENHALDYLASTPIYSLTAPTSLESSPPAVKDSFIDTDRTEASDHWNEGVVTFTSGSNSGFSMEAKDWDLTQRKMTLWEPMPYAIEPGTTYSLKPGCLKTLEACRDTYDNVVNFRGEPHLPGNDVLAQSPEYSRQKK